MDVGLRGRLAIGQAASPRALLPAAFELATVNGGTSSSQRAGGETGGFLPTPAPLPACRFQASVGSAIQNPGGTPPIPACLGPPPLVLPSLTLPTLPGSPLFPHPLANHLRKFFFLLRP